MLVLIFSINTHDKALCFQITIKFTKHYTAMNLSKLIIVFTVALAAFAGKADAGKGTKVMGRIGHGVVSF